MIAVGVERLRVIDLVTVFNVQRQLRLRHVVDVYCKPMLSLNGLLVKVLFARPNADNFIRVLFFISLCPFL